MKFVLAYIWNLVFCLCQLGMFFLPLTERCVGIRAENCRLILLRVPEEAPRAVRKFGAGGPVTSKKRVLHSRTREQQCVTASSKAVLSVTGRRARAFFSFPSFFFLKEITVRREGMKMKSTSVFLGNPLTCPIYYEMPKASGISQIQRLTSRQTSIASAQTKISLSSGGMLSQ